MFCSVQVCCPMEIALFSYKGNSLMGCSVFSGGTSLHRINVAPEGLFCDVVCFANEAHFAAVPFFEDKCDMEVT